MQQKSARYLLELLQVLSLDLKDQDSEALQQLGSVDPTDDIHELRKIQTDTNPLLSYNSTTLIQDRGDFQITDEKKQIQTRLELNDPSAEETASRLKMKNSKEKDFRPEKKALDN